MKFDEVAYWPLDGAVGSIEAGPDQQERLEEFTNRIGSGEFHAAANAEIPCKCIDGRTWGDSLLLPNAAGGTLTLSVAEDLATNWTEAGGRPTTFECFCMIADSLQRFQYPIGGHTAVELHGAPTGCGANDKLETIYKAIATYGDAIRDAADRLGVAVPQDTHEFIVANAASRSEFSNPSDILDAMYDRSQGTVEELEGAHNEVIAVINKRPGMTLDRDAVQREFGDKYQAFNVDVWSFEKAAKTMDSGSDKDSKIIAMVYYNLATALVLCGPKMRIVELK